MSAAAIAEVVTKVLTGGGEDEIQSTGSATDVRYWSQAQYAKCQALVPDWEPEDLAILWENSTLLRPCIDAYKTNLHGFGYEFEPVIDLEKEDADEKVRDSLLAERIAASLDPVNRVRDPALARPVALPTDAEVAARTKELAVQIRAERVRAEAFFASAATGEGVRSWRGLQFWKTEEKEILGNAYWELLLTAAGELALVNALPSYTIRLMPLRDEDWLPVQVPFRISAVADVMLTVRRPFRRFVQLVNGFEQFAYFKTVGDPRVISNRTGATYETPEKLMAAEPSSKPATEVLHWPIPQPRSPYGIPRWHGAGTAVPGQHWAEEATAAFLRNHAIPDTLVTVSGPGQVDTKAMTEMLNQRHRGTHQSGRVMVAQVKQQTEGQPLSKAEGASGVNFEVHQLTEKARKDAFFLDYQHRNDDVVGAQYRVPPILRGMTADLNRATAFAALQQAEQQVFGPLRDEDDETINAVIMPRIRCRLIRYKSKGPILRDPSDVAIILERLSHAGATFEDLRASMGDVLGRPLARHAEPALAERPRGATQDQPADSGGDRSTLRALARSTLRSVRGS